MTSPVITNPEVVVNVGQSKKEESSKVSWSGRMVERIPTSYKKASGCQKAGGTLVCLFACSLIIAGFTMYGVEKKECDKFYASNRTEGSCNTRIRDAGLGLGIAGASIFGIEIAVIALVCCCACACFACFACCKK